MATDPTTADDTPLDHIETFFEFIFGEDVLPVRTFDDVQTEMDFLEGGGVYATDGACQVCGRQHAPFIVSTQVTADRERIWRATCLDCYGQVRVPATVDDENRWQLHDEAADIVALEPVPTYHEQPVDMDPQAAPTDGETDA